MPGSPASSAIRASPRRAAAQEPPQPLHLVRARHEGPRGRPCKRAGKGSGLARELRRAAGQQPVVQRNDRRGGRRPELLAQQSSQTVVRQRGLGDVPARGERLHHQGVGGLAVGRRLHESACRTLGVGGPPCRERGVGFYLERAERQFPLHGAPLIDPWRAQARQQLLRRQGDGPASSSRRGLVVSALQRRFGRGERRLGLLDVDGRTLGQDQSHAPTPVDAVRAEYAPHSAQQSAQ